MVWRSWSLVPDHGTDGEPGTLLTGLYGFPWRDRQVDAKCTQQDRAVDGVDMRTRVDRYHRVVPAEHCTCGIYAGRDELVNPRVPKPPRGRPLVTGFVELGGHMIQEPEVYRAQRATIVGPLTIWVGRMPPGVAAAARLGKRARPVRVVTARDEYRVLWTRGKVGTPIGEWLASVTTALTLRYAVQVIAPEV